MKRTIITMLMVVILGIGPKTVWAGNNVWTNIGPAGGTVWSVVADPQNRNTVYARIDFASSGFGLFKSSDGGAT